MRWGAHTAARLGLLLLLAASGSLLGSRSACEAPEGSHTPLPGRDDYREVADGAKVIKDTLEKAKRDGRTVAVVFGGDWDVWSHAFHTVLDGDPEVATLIGSRYRVITVDSDHNQELLEDFLVSAGPESKTRELARGKHRFPVVAVLESDGDPRVVIRAGLYRRADGHLGYDDDKVLAFFRDALRAPGDGPGEAPGEGPKEKDSPPKTP